MRSSWLNLPKLQMSSRLLTTTGILFAFIVIFLSFTANTNNQPRPPPMTLLRPPRIIIVGSGLAGLSAAYTALAFNHPVTLLDRSPRPGGNSIKASSGINGAPTPYQTTDDTLFLADTIKSAGARYQQDAVRPNDGTRVDREGLARRLIEDSAGAIEWLTKDLDIDLKVVTALGGHSVARTHRGSGSTPPGAALITGLLTKLKSHKNFELIPSAEVLKLVTNPSAPGSPVTGVEFVRTGSGGVAWTERLAGPVVFATGGFAGDSRAGGLLEKYRLDLKGFPATAEARPGATGILEAVGAVPVDMEAVQIHPTGFVAPGDEGAASKFLAAEILRGVGGVMMRGGKRFVNEMGLRSAVSRVIMEGEDRWVRGTRLWDVDLVMDEGAAKAAEGHMQFYLWKGLMNKVPGAELSPEVQASIREYSKIVVGETADSFGRKDFGKWSVKPDDDIAAATFYVGKVTPVVHFTMGGVAFDTEARVLRRAGDGKLEAIPGLWAAGEVTGGLHGDNRLGGSSLLECVVFGRIAGRKAAENLLAAASN